MKDLKVYFGANDFIALTLEDDKVKENVDMISTEVKWICNNFENAEKVKINSLTINTDKILYFTVEDHVE